jgi:predicted 2-oxoglutarate/Fe(II)-dependent dioxygenase YbiX
MQPVTRGMRLAAIFRIHSLVREIARSYNVSHSTISRL